MAFLEEVCHWMNFGISKFYTRLSLALSLFYLLSMDQESKMWRESKIQALSYCLRPHTCLQAAVMERDSPSQTVGRSPLDAFLYKKP